MLIQCMTLSHEEMAPTRVVTSAKEEDLGVAAAGEVARKFKGFLQLRKTNASFVCPPGFFPQFLRRNLKYSSPFEGNVKAMVSWLSVVAKDHHRPL